MRVLTLLIVVSFIAAPVLAQTYVGGNAAQGTDMNTVPYGSIQEIDLRNYNAKIEHHYLDENWTQGTIQVKGGQTITNFPIRYDLLNGLMEIKADKEVKVLPKARIERFSLMNQDGTEQVYYTNLKSAEGVPVVGVFRVVEEGEQWILLNQTTITIIPPTYNKVLDSGDEEEKKLLKQDYLFHNGTALVQTGGSRKKFVEQFPAELQPRLLTFMKEARLGTKNELDLLQIANFLNR